VAKVSGDHNCPIFMFLSMGDRVVVKSGPFSLSEVSARQGPIPPIGRRTIGINVATARMGHPQARRSSRIPMAFSSLPNHYMLGSPTGIPEEP